jgi:chromosome partitioning protein
MNYKIAFANQKGGVGKTTSAVSIGAELAKLGRKVLLLDLDPQCSATSGVGCQPISGSPDIYDLFLGNVGLEGVIIHTPIENLDLIPSSRDLVSLEVEIGKKPGRELILKTGFSLLTKEYDYVLMDCPPSSGLLTLNALGAADKVLVPLQAEYYALEGLSALMSTIKFVQGTFNPQLSILGVFMTMYDSRTNLSGQVEGEARGFFQDLMFEAKIPRSIKISEAPSHGLPIGVYDPASPGAAAYRRLAAQIDERCYANREIAKIANG